MRMSGIAACLAAVVLALAPPAAVHAAAVVAPSDSPAASVYRVSGVTPAELARLTSAYDVLEARSGADYFVLGDAATPGQLRAEGFRVTLDRRLPTLTRRPGSQRAPALATVYATFFGGYHTVAAHRQHLLDVASTYPALATVVDYGDSWLKTKGRGGNDLLAICITHKAAGDCALSPNAPKPRSVVYAAIHARELATAEIAWNWIDYLTTSYGSDPTGAAGTSCDGFMPPYSCVTSRFWPQERQALLVLAQAAAGPYR